MTKSTVSHVGALDAAGDGVGVSKLNDGELVFGLATRHLAAFANSDVGDQAALFLNQSAFDMVLHVIQSHSRSHPHAFFKPLLKHVINVLECINEDTLDLLVLNLLGDNEGLILHQEIVLEIDFLETASRRAIKDHLCEEVGKAIKVNEI